MKYKLDNIIYMTLFNKETGQPIWTDDDSVENITLESDDEDVKFYDKPEIGSHVFIEGNINDKTAIRIEGLYGGTAE